MGIKIKRIAPLIWEYEFDGWHAAVFCLVFIAIFLGIGAWGALSIGR